MYHNVEVKYAGGSKIKREVHIKDGKGYKMVSEYKGGKRLRTVKKSIKKAHIQMIESGRFIPGLFSDCSLTGCRRKTRRNARV